MSSILGEFGDKILAELADILKTNKKKGGEVGKKQLYADIIVRNENGEILLLQRSYQDDFMAGKWCLAGGKIEQGEDPAIAAKRELQEETAINAQNLIPVKQVEKENCIIHYFTTVVPNDVLIVLDNEEHYRYEFVPIYRLDRYDMILDLGEVLQNQLLPEMGFITNPISVPVEPDDFAVASYEDIALQIEEVNLFKHNDIVKAFDAEQISDDDFGKYLQIRNALHTITKAYDQDLISTDQFFEYLEKGKHYEFVRVVRDGKQFYQYREVGTDHIQEDVEVGTTIETNAILDLRITKYSDKSILISGATYKNLELLRKAKEAANGLGTFNKALNGWIFPLFVKDKVLALMAQKMSIDTYDETKAKEAAIELKNSVDVGTEVSIGGQAAEVKETGINEEGKVEYTVETKEPESKPIAPATFEEKLKTAYNLGVASIEKDFKAPIHDKELLGLSENPYNAEGIKLMAAWNEGRQKALFKRNHEEWERKQKEEKEKEAIQPEPKQEESKVDEVPIGTISPDGKYVKTANGWEWIKQEKKVTEEEVAIPPADEKKAEELINNATEENRFKTGKQLFGKEEGEKPVSAEIEQEGQKEVKIEVREFTARSGEKINALDFTHIKHDEISLADPEDVLDKPKPYYIPDINEYKFSGYKDHLFILNAVKLEGDNYLVPINGRIDKKEAFSYGKNNKRDVDNEQDYAVMSLDVLVATTEYYRAKRKAELKRDAIVYNAEQVKDVLTWDQKKLDYYKPWNYSRLSEKQKKKYSEEAWNNLPVEEKAKEIPYMKSPVVSIKSETGRINVLKDNKMTGTSFAMYQKFVDKNYKIPTYGFDRSDPAYQEFIQTKQLLEYKANDMEIQREENGSSYDKGRETSYGDSNTEDDLLHSHGVKIKAQNGKGLRVDQKDQIKDHLNKVYESFGNRASMSKQFGLKISHSGEKLMHARKALGLYVPSMKAIGVSNDPLAGKFGFTLAHEFAHFIDNYVGKQRGRHFASDDYSSTAGRIASIFRENMNKKSDSNYMNRTCECFARALEQYHAMKHEGEDAIKYQSHGIPYHKDDNQVSKEKFNTLVKPIIEQFLSENDHLLKSAYSELDIIDINNGFELIKSAFNSEQIDLPTFLQYSEKYNDIVKGDPSHGGKLVKKTIVDKKGHKTTEWVKRDEGDKKKDSSKPHEPVKHSTSVLSAFAKETPAAELKRVINESKDERLRQAAHAELDRRDRREKVKKKDKK